MAAAKVGPQTGYEYQTNSYREQRLSPRNEKTKILAPPQIFPDRQVG